MNLQARKFSKQALNFCIEIFNFKTNEPAEILQKSLFSFLKIGGFIFRGNFQKIFLFSPQVPSPIKDKRKNLAWEG
jgi:hypothetical protein